MITIDFILVHNKVLLFSLLGLCVLWGLHHQTTGNKDVVTCGGTCTFRLATFVADHMVLQREPQLARIWGWASVGANVTVKLNGGDVLSFDIVNDSSGSWAINLPPQPAGAGHTLEISDGNSNFTLQNVAFGDVFLCSGQSNMEFTVDGSFNATQELADSINYPNLRVATVNKTMSSTPQEDAGSKASYIWAPSSPSSLQEPDSSNEGPWGVFSATCYFFGRELYKAMDGTVPVGLVTSSWGGQRVEQFSSTDAMRDQSCGGTLPVEPESNHASVDRAKMAVPVKHWYENESWNNGPDSAIWNAMIHPLLPMRFSGAVWYQGESNVHDPSSYACRFPAMITDWRRKFDIPDLAFVYVELAALRASNWPYIRAGQAAALQLPGVGMATAIDLSDQNSPFGAVHPRRKQEVGRRLALSMRALHYQDPDAEQKYSGPVFVSAALGIDSAHSTATLTFQLGTTNNLHLAGTADCKNCCLEPPFEVLTADRSWKRVSLAQVRNQDQVFLITNEPSIFGVRYAWEGRPECALYNGYGGPDDHAGLPSAPFQWCAYPIGRGAWTHESCRVPMPMNASIAEDESKLVLQDSIIKRTTERALIQAPVELRLPTFVDSHMVLQRTPHKSRIWGWASPGLAVTATLIELGVQVETIADVLTGFWVLDFPPQPASERHSIKITDGQNLIMLEDIAFGDVFLCSGQSNMQMPVSGAFNAKEEIADSINYPNLRLATVGSVTSDEEMEDAPSRSYYSWARSSPEALTNNATSITEWTPVFSATCYFFGRDLYQSMNGTVPIGLVVSSWGGQTVETFSSLDALIDNTCGGTVPGVVSVQDNAAGIRAVERTDVSSTSHDDKPQATQLWNAMIHPLRHMRFAGALWYQGEANSQDATSYACRFPAMITDWRLKFDLPDLTFLYVELAGFTPGSTWPWVRAAQAAALSLPQVGGATAIDLGDTHDAPHGEIHPRRKQKVGRRLALKMRAIHYQDESAIWNSMGPVWRGIQFDSNDEDRVTISLSFEGFTAHGLYFAGSADCTQCCDEPPFHILTKSGGWVRAESVSVMVSESRILIVTGTNNSSVIYGLRYAWEPRPECILYNHVNLPASPLEWCVYPTGQPPWTNQSCGGGMNDFLFHGTDSEDRTNSFKSSWTSTKSSS